MNPLDIANSGSMPINGGHASASNGDQVFDGRAEFGGIHYKTGLNPWWVVGGALVVAGLTYWAVKHA